jgi:hypothetical protein
MMRRLLLATTMLLAASPADAQSIFNAAGLGLPTEPTDARSRALGSFGVGLWGSSLQPGDPGSAGFLEGPAAIMVAQPSWVDFDRNAGETGSSQGTRFPLIGIGYPLMDGMFTVTLSSFLDQRFESEREISYSLQDVSGVAKDIFEQDGAVSQITFGYSRHVMGSTGVGFSVGRYAGSLTRRLSRDFGDVVNATSIVPFQTGGLWSYSGASVTGGFATDIGTIARVSGSATWSGSLNATASSDSQGSDKSFDLPLQYRVGASAILAPGLRVAASIVRADWADVAPDLTDAAAVGGTGGFGVGVELSRARLLGAGPLRFGYRQSDLPFAFGTTPGTESVWSTGLGITLNETNGIVLAGADIALERGTRIDSSLTEKFWRMTVSLRVMGY